MVVVVVVVEVVSVFLSDEEQGLGSRPFSSLRLEVTLIECDGSGFDLRHPGPLIGPDTCQSGCQATLR